MGNVITDFLMLGGLSLLSVVTAAIIIGFISRAESRRRTTGEDPVIQRFDQLATELQAVKAELEHRPSSSTTSADLPPSHRMRPANP